MVRLNKESKKELGIKSEAYQVVNVPINETFIEKDTDEICPSCGENVGWNCFDNTAECYECKTISKKTKNGFLVINDKYDIFKALGNILNPKGDK